MALRAFNTASCVVTLFRRSIGTHTYKSYKYRLQLHGLCSVSGTLLTWCVSVAQQHATFFATLYLQEVIVLSHSYRLPLPVGCMSY